MIARILPLCVLLLAACEHDDGAGNGQTDAGSIGGGGESHGDGSTDDATAASDDAAIVAPPDASAGSIDASMDAQTNVPNDASSNAPPDLTSPVQPKDMSLICPPCDQPPGPCYAPTGTCQNLHCVYAPIDGLQCSDGDPCTVGDICAAGVCKGTPRVCDQPPVSACVSSTKLLTYDAVGACNAGACVYAQHSVTCGAGGCNNNACSTDPCSGLTCNTPPSICYKPAGTCSVGQCSYAYNDAATCNDGDPCTDNDQCNTGVCKGKPKACVASPADVCEDTATLRVYDPVGACGAGTCSYPYHFITCPTGCAAGHCNASAWTAQASGVTVTLHNVWGASGNDVFTVGDTATLLHWNGANWKTMPLPQGTGNLNAIDGTASNNVFALGSPDFSASSVPLLRYDGTSWTKRADATCGDFCCLGAIGPDDVYTWNAYGQLNRYTNGVKSTLATMAIGTTLDHDCSVRVLSANDVYMGGGWTYHWDGHAITEVKATNQTGFGSQGLTAFGPTQVFSFSYSSVGRWDGSQWLVIPTGAGGVDGIGGTSPTRVFAVGGGANGAISFWDGSGWSGESIPAGTQYLYGVWAATTGEVYAVGAKGTILRAIH